MTAETRVRGRKCVYNVFRDNRDRSRGLPSKRRYSHADERVAQLQISRLYSRIPTLLHEVQKIILPSVLSSRPISINQFCRLMFGPFPRGQSQLSNTCIYTYMYV